MTSTEYFIMFDFVLGMMIGLLLCQDGWPVDSFWLLDSIPEGGHDCTVVSLCVLLCTTVEIVDYTYAMIVITLVLCILYGGMIIL